MQIRKFRGSAGKCAVMLGMCTSAGIAHAQSSISLYGLADAFVGELHPAGAAGNAWQVGSGGMTTSYWGMSGAEDLGGGMKAIFTLESFYRSNGGQAGSFPGQSFFGRNAFVGLSGHFGELTLGRNTAPLFVSTLLFNPFGNSFIFSPIVVHSFLGSAMGAASLQSDTAIDDSILYQTPEVGGLSGSLLYSNAGVAGHVGQANYSANVLYFAGPFSDDTGSIASSLGTRYVDALAGELEKEEPATFDMDVAMQRAVGVFSEQMALGEEARRATWPMVCRFMALTQPVAVRTAWQIAVSNEGLATDVEISSFVTAFARRLLHDLTDNSSEVDVHEAFAELMKLVVARIESLDESALQHLFELSTAWSRKDAYARLACDVVSQLRRVNTAMATAVLNTWAPRVISDLPFPCIGMLTELLPGEDDSLKVAAANTLTTILSADPINVAMADRYSAFVTGLPTSSWDKAPFKAHLDSALSNLANRGGNENYLKTIFPPIASVLHHVSGPVGRAG